jgi:hypothetical protein
MMSFLSWMAFDGFVVNVGKHEARWRDMNALVDHFADMLFTGEYSHLRATAGAAR